MSSYATWNQYTAYAVGDVVNYAGFDYVASAANQGAVPGVSSAWTLITPPLPPGALTNPLTTDLDLGTNDIINTNDTQTTTIGVDEIDLRAGSLAPRITVQAGADFASATPTLFSLAAPRTTIAPTIGDDLCNKTYVDSVAGGGGITNPLTADILAAGFSLQQANYVQANFLALPGGGFANPTLDITSPLRITDPTVPTQFTLPPQTAVAPTVGNDLTNKTYVDGLAVSLAGLYNTLRIVPTAAGQTVTPQTYTSVPTPSSWVPDATPNTTIVPTNTGPGTPWRLTKAPGGAGTRWWVWPYNPQYGLTPPFTAPSVTFTKKNLNAVYALIRVKTANIATQGAFFFNIYTYDYATPPASPQTFSTRFDYSLNNLALPLTTGALALQTEFVYLVYACDAPKIVATPSVLTTIAQANGQTPTQQTSEMLRDPFDIHTTIPHIPMSAVAVTNGAVVPSEINQVPVSALTFGCTSSAIAAGVDVEVLAVGYRANGGAINQEYSLLYS